MLKNQILIDFDGVILDSEARILKMKKENSDITWESFFDNLDWYKLLNESNLLIIP